MTKIMEDIANLTEGTSFNSYKYSFDSVRTPEPSYDDNPDGFTIVWDKNGETHPSKEPVPLRDYANQLAKLYEPKSPEIGTQNISSHLKAYLFLAEVLILKLFIDFVSCA